MGKRRWLLRLVTEGGEGEAVKDAQDEPWFVSLPDKDFRFHGSVAELKAHLRRLDRQIIVTEVE